MGIHAPSFSNGLVSDIRQIMCFALQDIHPFICYSFSPSSLGESRGIAGLVADGLTMNTGLHVY